MKPIRSRRLGAASALSLASLLAATPAFAEQTIQGTQRSDNPQSNSGASTSNNTNSFSAGASATGSNANALQEGSNRSSATQNGKSEAGDSVAGGQVVGAVGDDVTVQVTNDAEQPIAVSGLATVDNDLDLIVGANAEGGLAQTSQVGDNELVFDQDAVASGGDAVSGSQVTGIVGGGEHTLQANNTADCTPALGTGGPNTICASSAGIPGLDDRTVASNTAQFDVGALAAAVGQATGADAGQIGDNQVTGAAISDASSGDALFGSQVSGLVGGSATVQANNNSDCGFVDGVVCALSGNASADFNLGDGVDGETINVGTAAFGGTANASQVGSNGLLLDTAVSGSTGDALSGAQITGAVGGDELTVHVNNTADGAYSRSGDVLNDNETSQDVFVGAAAEGTEATTLQSGDNELGWDMASDGESGDAVAGGQVTGATGFDVVTLQEFNDADIAFGPSSAGATTGFVDLENLIDNDTYVGAAALVPDTGTGASSTQNGDNNLDVTQVMGGSTGDAVSAAQVAGVAGGTEITIQGTNTGIGAARVGRMDAENEIGDDFDTAEVVVGAATNSPRNTVTQNGDNSATGDQSGTVSSGDGVAGSQVTGVAAERGSTATVQVTNESYGSVNGGIPLDLELNDAEVDASNEISIAVGAHATYFQGSSVDTVTQNGDDTALFGQAIDATSGDAVGSSQISGIVADDATLQATNTPPVLAQSAYSGEVFPGDDDNQLFAFIGAGNPADAPAGEASVTQNGDASLDFTQTLTGSSGDAVDGSQVSGVVAKDSTVQVNNNARLSTAVAGDIDAENSASGTVGPISEAEADANVSHNGDAVTNGAQNLETSSGDAVAGSQVTGKA